MKSTDTLELAGKAYSVGLTDLAISIVDETIMEDSNGFYAWWLTETNEEYRTVDKKFLENISDYCKTI